MASVWFMGNQSQRIISSADWASVGVPGAQQNMWSVANGWSIPESSFTSAQLTILRNNPEFQTGSDDGPRIRTASIGFPSPSEAEVYYAIIKQMYDYIIANGIDAGVITALQNAVTTAHNLATSAQSTADTAETNAEAAQTSANGAQSTADTAQTIATAAGSAASAAQSTANSAASAASAAQSTANTAVANAATAQSAANAAQSTANGKISAGFGVAAPNCPSLDGFVLTPTSDVIAAANNGDVNGHGRQTIFTGDWTVSVSVKIDATGGTGRWAIGGKYADIAPGASASSVQTSLQALSTVGAGSVTVAGGPGGGGGGTPYVVSYNPKYIALGGVLPLTVDATNLTGGAHSATLTWSNYWGTDTAQVFGEDSYTVTGGGANDGNGIGIMYGALLEANQCGGGHIGTIVAAMGEAAFYNSNATGHVDTMISLNAAGPHYKGNAIPGSCTADNVYGLKVSGCQGSRQFTDGVITSDSPTITSATAQFTAIDYGKVVTGPGIPAGAYIIDLNPTSITLSQNCTGNTNPATVTINGTLNATNAWTAYFGPGSVGINGQTIISAWKEEVPLKVVGLFGATSDLLQLYSGPNRMVHFDKYGDIACASSIVAFEGQSPWQIVLGANAVSGTHPGISFGSPSNAAVTSPSSGIVAIAGGLQLGVGYTTIAGSRLWSGSGAPNISASAAGDVYFRTDTPTTSNQRIYVATAANTWTGIL